VARPRTRSRRGDPGAALPRVPSPPARSRGGPAREP
jgi:hypothetical protein